MLGPLFQAFEDLGVATDRVIYADDAVEDVRKQLFGLDGVLVWVNPIQDGANRRQLDALLRDVSSSGVWVSAHPEVIRKMGTKEVLFKTRSLGWGTETDVYDSPRDLAERFPSRLARTGRLVIKQARGTAGNGVWRVDLVDAAGGAASTPTSNARVRIQQAQPVDAPVEELTLATFLERLREYFAWSGSLVVQPYQSRLPDGMIRCYFVQDQVVGFCHQWPRGLLDESALQKLRGAPRQMGPMEHADAPAYQALRLKAESEWVPGMKGLLELDAQHMPIVWDADFLYGPKNEAGEDTYVLCEINISAVSPYPIHASSQMAETTVAAVLTARTART
jgi:hypothetical protein